MFMVSQQEAAAIQKAFHEGGEWAAVVELRRVFHIDDNACALDEAHLQAEDNASGQRPSAYHPLALEFAGDELERVPWHVYGAVPDLIASEGELPSRMSR